MKPSNHKSDVFHPGLSVSGRLSVSGNMFHHTWVIIRSEGQVASLDHIWIKDSNLFRARNGFSQNKMQLMWLAHNTLY